jgi:uncharacterized repeat protein (TIGR01451 family)
MKLFSAIKSKLKTSAGKTVAVLALIGAILLPSNVLNSEATGSQSQTPRFNFLQGDSEMLVAANYTKGQANWADPVSGSYAANIGDEIVFRFYFHNGVLNSTATNTIARALLPNTVGTQHRVLSHLWSDQTQAITDTVVNGTIVGYGAGFSEINLTTPGRLEYVAGSSKIWRDNPDQNGVTIPDGITSTNGINIGSISGCWEYSGYITFKARVKSAASIAIDKYVGYPGTGMSWDTILQNAKEGETVAWKIPVKNTGQTDALEVLVKDTLPATLTYIAGSTVYFGPDAPANGYQMPDGITGNGLYINNLKPGDANVVYFVFQTKIGTNLTYGSGGTAELVNTATATYNNQSVQDQARVIVSGVSGMTIEKKVWNGSAWVEQNNITLGQNIRYQIKIKNVGEVNLTGVVASDVIPVYTEYIAGSTKMNGNSIADGIASVNGISIGSIARGCEITLEFTVKTYGCPPVGDYTLVNTAYSRATNISAVSDTASTIMTLNRVSGPSVSNL